MKGNNELRLNTATVIEAIQAWVDGAFYVAHRPEVTGVKWDASVGVMIVSIKERELKECEQEWDGIRGMTGGPIKSGK